MSKNELYHYGIGGMRWGERRWQNPDGTLTPEGRLRYRNAETSILRKTDMVRSLISNHPGWKDVDSKSFRLKALDTIENRITSGILPSSNQLDSLVSSIKDTPVWSDYGSNDITDAVNSLSKSVFNLSNEMFQPYLSAFMKDDPNKGHW